MHGSESFSITLIHLGGEQKTVPVIDAYPEFKLTIRWGYAGVYYVDLKLNCLVGQGERAFRRRASHGERAWRPLDLEEGRRIYWKLIKGPEIATPKPPSYVQNIEAKSLAIGRLCMCAARETCDICRAMRKAL